MCSLKIIRSDALSEQKTSSQKLATHGTIKALRRWDVLREDDALAVTLVAIAVALLAASLPELLSGLRQVEVGSVQEVGVGEVASWLPAVDVGNSPVVDGVQESVAAGERNLMEWAWALGHRLLGRRLDLQL